MDALGGLAEAAFTPGGRRSVGAGCAWRTRCVPRCAPRRGPTTHPALCRGARPRGVDGATPSTDRRGSTPEWLALGGAKRGLGAEAPCWLDRAFAEHCQHEAEAPRPRFVASRLRVRSPAATSTPGDAAAGRMRRRCRARANAVRAQPRRPLARPPQSAPPHPACWVRRRVLADSHRWDCSGAN